MNQQFVFSGNPLSSLAVFTQLVVTTPKFSNDTTIGHIAVSFKCKRCPNETNPKNLISELTNMFRS
jgi:hypothetical protein